MIMFLMYRDPHMNRTPSNEEMAEGTDTSAGYVNVTTTSSVPPSMNKYN